MKPVFPPEVTRPMEDALQQARNAAFEQQRQQALRAQQEAIARGRPMPQTSMGYQQTSTPPQANGQFRPPQHQQHPIQSVQPPSTPIGQFPQVCDLQEIARIVADVQRKTQPQYPQPTHYPQPQPIPAIAQRSYQQPRSYQTPAPPVDLPSLNRDIEDLVRATQGESAIRPFDSAIRGRLDALIALQVLLKSQYHPPDQLQQVRNQVNALQAASRSSAPVSTPPILTSSTPAISQPPSYHQPANLPVSSIQQQPIHTPTPQPQDLQALLSSRNLADIIANAQRTSSTPPIHQMSIAPPPSSTPATDPTKGQPMDLMASLRQAGIVNGASAPSSQPTSYGTPPLSGATQTRQGPINDVELTSASLKIPRPHLLSLLYESQPNQCTTCGRRFLATEEGREKKRKHYDWHFKTKVRMNDAAKRAQNRSWYVDELDWIRSRDDPEGNNLLDAAGAASGTPTSKAAGVAGAPTTAKDDPTQRFVPVPSDSALANQPCPICQEKFTASYNDEVSDWVWMDAVQIGSRIYHASCHSEMKKNASRDVTPLRMGTPDSVLGKRKAVEGISPVGAKLIKA